MARHKRTRRYAKLCGLFVLFSKGKILDILDFGCGTGRDVKYFQSLGHRPIGLDGSEVFCDMALNIQVVRFFIRNF